MVLGAAYSFTWFGALSQHNWTLPYVAWCSSDSCWTGPCNPHICHFANNGAWWRLMALDGLSFNVLFASFCIFLHLCATCKMPEASEHRLDRRLRPGLSPLAELLGFVVSRRLLCRLVIVCLCQLQLMHQQFVSPFCRGSDLMKLKDILCLHQSSWIAAHFSWQVRGSLARSHPLWKRCSPYAYCEGRWWQHALLQDPVLHKSNIA